MKCLTASNVKRFFKSVKCGVKAPREVKFAPPPKPFILQTPSCARYFTFAQQIFHTRSVFHLPAGQISLKKALLTQCFFLVETTGLEPVTPCMSSMYSSQLSYASV